MFEGTLLFYPVIVMGMIMFVTGMLGITSYTIRISATQGYVPDGMKGRFNGAFNMLNTVDMLAGEITAGAMGDLISPKYVILFFGMLTALAAVILIGGNKSSVEVIYNTQQ